MGARERRGLDRCRRALTRGRRVRGRPLAADDHHGLLVDLGGELGHVPASEVAAGSATANAWRGRTGAWEGWVVAVTGDLVHLAARHAPDDDADDGPLRSAEVLTTGRSGAVVRLDDGSVGVLPWEELSWEPAIGALELERGQRVEGRVVALSLDGPVLSPRAATPSPWPAIALALPRGTPVTAHVEAVDGDRVLLRTDRAPRAVALLAATALPGDAQEGAVVQATVERVNAHAGTLVLDAVTPAPRAPRHAPAARKRGPRGPEQAASGSRS